MTVAAEDRPVVAAMRAAVPGAVLLADDQLIKMAKAAVGALLRRAVIPGLTVEQAERAESAVARHLNDAPNDAL